MTDVAATPRSGRPRSAESTTAILDAGLALWMERGYHAVSIDAVAARAGVSKPTIYRRWPNRQQLLVAVSQRFVPPGEIGDLGSFHDEVAAFLRNRAELYGDSGIRCILASAVGILVYLYVFNQLLLFGAAWAATSPHGRVVDLSADDKTAPVGQNSWIRHSRPE